MASEKTTPGGPVLGAAFGCLAVVALSSVAAHGAEAPPAALANARLAFAAAVAAKDLSAVWAITTFPLKVTATGQPLAVAQSALSKFVLKNGYAENAACHHSGALERRMRMIMAPMSGWRTATEASSISRSRMAPGGIVVTRTSTNDGARANGRPSIEGTS